MQFNEHSVAARFKLHRRGWNWLKREYESKHKNEHIIRVITNIKNWINKGSEVLMNCGKSADVNIIAFGFVNETRSPWE